MEFIFFVLLGAAVVAVATRLIALILGVISWAMLGLIILGYTVPEVGAPPAVFLLATMAVWFGSQMDTHRRTGRYRSRLLRLVLAGQRRVPVPPGTPGRTVALDQTADSHVSVRSGDSIVVLTSARRAPAER